MTDSAGEVVFLVLLQVDCTGVDVPPGDSDGGERTESHPQVREGGRRLVVPARGQPTPPDTMVCPPSLQGGQVRSQVWRTLWNGLYLEGDVTGVGSNEDDMSGISGSSLSLVTNIAVPVDLVLQIQYAEVLVYWRFPETQHPGSASSTGQSDLATFSDEMSELDSAGLYDSRVTIIPHTLSHTEQQQEEQEVERGRRSGAGHYQAGPS